MRRDEDGKVTVKRLVLICALGLIAAGILNYYAPYRPSPPAEDLMAEDGDAVEIDYVGSFDDGRVFDTSLWDVAIDNSTYPKSPGFDIRGTGRTSYTPFSFLVGSGQSIDGFDRGVVGMRVAQSRLLHVTPDRGYGFGDPALRTTRPLVEEVPALETITQAEFQLRYLIPAGSLHTSSIGNPTWGWNATVFVSGDLVTVRQSPVVGKTYRIYDRWDVLVESVDDSANSGIGEIRVRHLLTEEDGGTISGSEYGRPFFLRSVDPSAGTWVQDFNGETVGVNLNFQITLVSLEKA